MSEPAIGSLEWYARRTEKMVEKLNPEMAMGGEFKKLFPLERLEQMVNAHAMEFGVEPTSIQIPTPDFVFRGIKVRFVNLPQHYTIDHKNCLHHQFTNQGEKK